MCGPTNQGCVHGRCLEAGPTKHRARGITNRGTQTHEERRLRETAVDTQ